MRTSRRRLTVVAAAGGLLIAGSPAIPAQAAPSEHICLENAQSYCLQSNGTGQQVTITLNPAKYSNFTKSRTRSGGQVQFENGNGNCLRAANGNVVVIENGPCQDVADNWWYAPANQIFRLRSESTNDDLTVHGRVDGWNVWHIIPGSGDWYNWVGA